MSRQNISEELKLNDDIVLDDGSDKKEELEKDGEELEKEVQKELDAKIDIADEIREAEAEEFKATNALGKTTKIKNFTEKLILEEPSNVLNEEVDTIAFDERDEAVHAVYNALAKYARFLYFDADLGHEYFDEEGELENFDIFEELENVCDEVMMRLNDGEWAM
jgi:hypothetical protein